MCIAPLKMWGLPGLDSWTSIVWGFLVDVQVWKVTLGFEIYIKVC